MRLKDIKDCSIVTFRDGTEGTLIRKMEMSDGSIADLIYIGRIYIRLSNWNHDLTSKANEDFDIVSVKESQNCIKDLLSAIIGGIKRYGGENR